MPIKSLTIDNLPCELMLNIFEYLPIHDRIHTAPLTCTSWYEILNHLNYLLNDTAVVFGDNVTVSMDQTPITVLMKRYKRVRSIKLMKEVQFRMGCDAFWASVGTNLTEIEFVHCEYLTNDVLTGILRHLRKLKVLKLYAPLFRRWKLFQKNRFLINEENIRDLRETLESITHLTLCDSKINDVHFLNLMQNLPNLNCFDGTSLYFRSDDYGTLTTNAFLQWLDYGAEKLKELHLKNVDNAMIEGLSNVNGLALRSCSLQIDTISLATLDNFIQNQNLDSLALDLSKYHRSEALLQYLEHITCLTELKLGIDCTSTNIASYHRFNNLKKLSIHLAPTELPSDGSEFYIKSGQNPKLRELEIISDIHYCPNSTKSCTSFIRMVNNYKKLTNFTISGIAITDKEVQSIFRVMQHLRELKITNCEKITDKGMTGRDSGNNTTFKQYSLQNLQGLRRLSLSNCAQITDKSLKESFILPELQYLSMNGANYVTPQGLNYLPRGMPSLEEIMLRTSTFIDKTDILAFKSKFMRLKKLSVNTTFDDIMRYEILSRDNNGQYCFPFDR